MVFPLIFPLMYPRMTGRESFALTFYAIVDYIY